MKFYFCQACGTRLTEDDIEAGVARNKKLKGVFCSECAVGVTTMESLPLSNRDARDLLGKETPTENEPPARNVPARRRTSAASIPTARRRRPSDRVSDREVQGAGAHQASRASSLLPYVIGGFVAAIAIGIATLSAQRAPDEKSRPVGNGSKKREPQREVQPTLPDRPVQADPGTPAPRRQLSTRTETPPPDRVEASKAPVEEPAPPVKPPDNEAKASFEQLKRFDGIGDDDYEARIARVEAYLKKFAQTPSAESARRLLADMQKAQAEARARKAEQEEQALAQRKKTMSVHVAAFRAALKSNDLAAAAKVATNMSKDEALGAWKAAGEDAEAIVEALLARAKQREEVLKKWVGQVKRIRFTAFRQPVRVKILAVERGKLRGQRQFSISGQSHFKDPNEWALGEISPETWARFLPQQDPATPRAWLVAAAASWIAGDTVKLRQALEHCPDRPLTPHLRRELDRLEMGERELAARDLYQRAEKLYEKGKWKEAQAAYGKLDEQFGKTRIRAAHADRIAKRQWTILNHLSSGSTPEGGRAASNVTLVLPTCYDFLGNHAHAAARAPKEIDAHLVFNVVPGGSETRSLPLKNASTEARSWRIVGSVPWLRAKPAAGRIKAGEQVDIQLVAQPQDTEAVSRASALAVFEDDGSLSQRVKVLTHVMPLYRPPKGLPPGTPVPLSSLSRDRVISHRAMNHQLGTSSPGRPDYGPIYAEDKSIKGGLHQETVFNLEGQGYTAFSASVRCSPNQRTNLPVTEQFVNFEVHVDGRLAAQSGFVSFGKRETRTLVAKNLTGAKRLKIVTRVRRPEEKYLFKDRYYVPYAHWEQPTLYRAPGPKE